ncbi:MAG: hypothetical protein HY550_05135 [Elusimicrobia bacterium]|nr:hypothetical protein [Elusimicrobiota bacterium]
MNILNFLSAPHMGVAELRGNLSGIIRGRKTVVATERGKPAEVVLSYDVFIQLLTQLQDLTDKRMAEVVNSGVKAIRSGSKGLPAGSSLKKHLKK